MFDSYNIRKIAPRMLLAVIGVNLSIYLCVAAVDVVNVVGGGLAELIRGPFLDTNTFNSIDIDTGSGTGGKITTGVVGLVAVGAGATGFLGTMLGGAIALASGAAPFILIVLLLLILAGILIALAIMATVVIRYGAIILLTLVSPVAISLLVLPGTEKYFRKWWEYFTKTLMVYPIIAAIFAVSDVMGAVFLKAQRATGGPIQDIIVIFVVIVVVYAPLFMIPFAFKLSGGFLGSIYDLANKNMYGRAKPHIDKWKEKPDGYYNKTRGAAKEAANRAYLNPSGWVRGTRNALDARKSVGSRVGGQSRRSHFRDAFKGGYTTAMGDTSAEEAEALQKRYGNLDGYDDLMNVAQTHYGRDQESIMKALNGLDSTKYNLNDPKKRAQTMQAASQIMRMQREMGSEERMRRAGVVSMSTAKTAFKDHDEMLEFVDKAAGDDSTLRSMLLAKVQKNQDSAGRKDVAGGGFTESSVSLESRVQKRKELEAKGMSGDTLNKELRKYGEGLTDQYLDVVAKKNSDVSLGQAHERSFNATTQHTMKRMKQATEKAQVRVDNGEIEDVADDEAVQAYTARLENLGESSAYFSGANRELVSKVLTADRVETLAGDDFKVAKQKTVIDPVRVRTTVKVKRQVTDSAGEVVYEDVPDPRDHSKTVSMPKMEVVETPADLSVRELADKKMRGNSEKYSVYNTNKREFGRAEDAELDAASRFGGGPGPSAGI